MRERLNMRGFLDILIPPVVYVIIQRLMAYVMVFAVMGMSFLGVLNGNSLYQSSASWNQLGFIATAFAALAAIPIFLKMQSRDEERFPSDYRYESVPIWKYVYIIILGFLMSLGLNQLLGILNIDQLFPGYQETAESLYSMNIWMELVVLGVIVPVAEELIFRGVVYERIRRYCSVRAAAFWCALFFGIYHGNVSQGIYAFLLGLFMVYGKEKYHTMAAPIFFHMSANICSVLTTETSMADVVYFSLEMFFAVMILSFAFSFLCIWRIQEEIEPEKVKKNREWHNDSDFFY